MSFNVPIDPTTPRDPVIVPRGRPGTVTLAVVLIVGGAALGLISALVVMSMSGVIADGFRSLASGSTATPDQLDSVATRLRALTLAFGLLTGALAVVIGVFAIGVWRGSNAARIATLVLIVPAIFGTSTAFGMGSRTTGALGAAIPGWFASLSGGLGCLQVLGYIAVLVLLVVPASNLYFRRRPAPVQQS